MSPSGANRFKDRSPSAYGSGSGATAPPGGTQRSSARPKTPASWWSSCFLPAGRAPSRVVAARGIRLSLLHQGSSLRSSRAPRLTAGALRSCLRPALGPGYAGRATRAREPGRGETEGTRHASGGGAQTPGWTGRRWRVAAESWRASWAPIPTTFAPGRAEQSRPRASRSFVQWRAPP